MTLVATISNNKLWQEAIAAQPLPTLEKIPDKSKLKQSYCLKHPLSMEEVSMLADGDAKLLITYQSPDLAIANLLQSGKGLEEALATWKTTISRLLSIQKSHRRKLSLLNLEQLTMCSADGFDTLKKLGWPFTQKLAYQKSSIYRVIATQALLQDDELRRLVTLLIASSHSLTEDKLGSDLNHALDEYRHHEEKKENFKSKLDEEQSENSKVLAKLLETQAALEKESDGNSELLTQLLEVQSALESEVTKNSVLEHEKENSKRLLTELLKVQRALEEEVTKNAECEEKQKQSDYAVERLETENKQLLEKLLRTQSLLEENVVAEDGARQENAKLTLNLDNEKGLKEEILAQLLMVQEQLESYYSDYQNEVKNNKAQSDKGKKDRHVLNERLKRQAKQHEREVQKLLRRNEVNQGKIVSLTHQVSLLEKQLEEITSSALWKASAPVRKVNKIVKKANLEKERLKEDVKLITASEYFDKGWYLDVYPDVAKSGDDPATHYLLHGAKEGRRPSVYFDGDWYLSTYPDVAASGLNPLIHFLRYGCHEQRTPSPKLLEDHSKN